MRVPVSRRPWITGSPGSTAPGSRAPGDAGDRATGLVRREPAELDRGADAVAGRPGALAALDARVVARADEALARRRARRRWPARAAAGSRTAARPRSARPPGPRTSAPPRPPGRLRRCAAPRRRAAAPPPGGAAPLAEHRRAARAPGVTTITSASLAHAGGLARGHQRELVGRQRPRGAGRDDDRQPAGVALLQVAQQAAVDLRVAARPPRRRAGTPSPRVPRGEQQRVVAERPAAREP